METAQEQRAGAAAEHFHYEVQDASPVLARTLRQRVSGCHWGYQIQLLEILEWVCGTDRQFDHARKRALDLINGQERAMAQIITGALAPAREDGNGTAQG